jgi:Rrf2 family transcriptional regulator, cysteine metabolism repressor
MKITAKAEYACLAVIDLARSGNGTPRRIKDIAEAQGIPERYLVQILLQLKSVGLVQSARGSVGGYHLVRPADRISVADVITAIDGPADAPRTATSPAGHDLGELLRRAWAAEREVLASTTIAQLTNTDPPLDWVV